MNDTTLATIDAHYLQTHLDDALPEPTDSRKTRLEVREDRPPYRTDTTAAEDFDSSALGDAEDLLDEASNLVGLTRAVVENEGDIRLIQIETAMKAVERRLHKARARIDEHDTCHTRLLSAYRDLKKATERSSG